MSFLGKLSAILEDLHWELIGKRDLSSYWEANEEALAWVCAGLLNGAHIVVMSHLSALNLEIEEEEEEYYYWHMASQLLILLSFTNFGFLIYLSSKPRQLLLQDPKKRPSPNAFLGSFHSEVPSLFTQLKVDLGFAKPPVLKDAHWDLWLWNPSKFLLVIFCFYSPPQALVLEFFYSWPLAIILPINCIVIYIVVKSFQQLVFDKQLIANEAYQTFSDEVSTRMVVRYKVDDQNPNARPQHGETFYYVPARVNTNNPIPAVDQDAGFLGGEDWST